MGIKRLWQVLIIMKDDFCVRCGSENIKIVAKRMDFDLNNPGKISVIQECSVCQECDETYFDEKQIDELSEKINQKNKV